LQKANVALRIDEMSDSRWVRQLHESGFVDRTFTAQGVK
jgi:hypothetical protein